MHSRTPHGPAIDPAALLDAIAFVATEHEGALDMTRLVDLIDLYAHHLRESEGSPACSFEAFVRDSLALAQAASLAAADSGIETRAPEPLGANAGTPPEHAEEQASCRAAHSRDGIRRVVRAAAPARAAPPARPTGPVRLRLV